MTERIILGLGWTAVVGSILIQTVGSLAVLFSVWPWVLVLVAIGCAAWLRSVKLAWGVVVAVLWPIAVFVMFFLFMGAP